MREARKVRGRKGSRGCFCADNSVSVKCFLFFCLLDG